MRQRNWWTLTWALVFGAMFTLVNAGFGDDNENSSSKKSNNNTAGDQATNRDQDRQQNGREQSRRADDDDDNVQHHAALGVSLNESDGHVRVIAVAPGGPAAKAGLRVGDEIRYVGDERIRTAQGLAEEIADYHPGEKVDLSIRRNGERQTVQAQLASRETAFRSMNQNQNDDQGAARSNRNGQANRSDMQANRSGMQASRGRNAYSYGPNDDQSERNQHLQHLHQLQQQVWQLQQEINSLQASLGQSPNQGNMNANQNSNQPSGNRTQTGVQGGYYGGQQTQFLDRTNQRYSNRGFSRDHGPRETPSGNTANED